MELTAPGQYTFDFVTSATNMTCNAWLPAAATPLQYDNDGNLANDGQWTYFWDTEHTRRRVGWVDRAKHGPGRHARQLRLCFLNFRASKTSEMP